MLLGLKIIQDTVAVQPGVRQDGGYIVFTKRNDRLNTPYSNMEIAGTLIDRIFDIQEKAKQKNLRDSNVDQRYEFTARCFELVADNLRNLKCLTDKDHEAIHLIFNDALSTIVCAMKIGLYGDMANAFLLSRLALEHLSIADYVIEKGEYRRLREGLDKGLQRVRLDFESIGPSIDRKVIKLHGKISQWFGHATRERYRHSHFPSRYEIWGASLREEKVLKVMNHLCNVCLFATRVLRAYFEKNSVYVESFYDRQDQLERDYLKINSRAES